MFSHLDLCSLVTQQNFPYLVLVLHTYSNLLYRKIILAVYVPALYRPRFLDAIASPRSYPCQWVSQSVIHSFRLEIAIAYPSFASFLDAIASPSSSLCGLWGDQWVSGSFIVSDFPFLSARLAQVVQRWQAACEDFFSLHFWGFLMSQKVNGSLLISLQERKQREQSGNVIWC